MLLLKLPVLMQSCYDQLNNDFGRRRLLLSVNCSLISMHIVVGQILEYCVSSNLVQVVMSLEHGHLLHHVHHKC